MLNFRLICVALKRLQTELEITTNDTVIIEESDEILSSNKTTSPSLKKSPKSSDFGMKVYVNLMVFQPNLY